MTERVDQKVLRRFVPVCNLTNDNFGELAKKAVVEHLEAGKALFKEGQKDSSTFYLLEGEIEIKNAEGVSSIIMGGSKESLQPLANRQPRQETAVARTDISFIGIDTDMLDVLLTWDQTASYVVTEINEEDDEADSDWMTKILQSNVFLQIPPANIQKMFMQMEQVPMQPGETIMRQGDPGDYYYILQRGSCEVSRAAPDGRQIKLAVLNQGDGFGEEALISDTVRNATITMTTEGSLMRLSKEDFNELLQQPILNNVTYEQAQEMMSNEGAVLVDVRLENEFEGGNLPNSVNIPLYLLRIRLSKMNPEKKYVVYCDSGGRSAAAAYIISERGINVFVLSGGMQAATAG